MYEYKTVVQDTVCDPETQQKLDDDLNLICREGGWEVFDVSVIKIEYNEIQKVYTLRRNIFNDDERVIITAPARHAEIIQKFVQELK